MATIVRAGPDTNDQWIIEVDGVRRGVFSEPWSAARTARGWWGLDPTCPPRPDLVAALAAEIAAEEAEAVAEPDILAEFGTTLAEIEDGCQHYATVSVMGERMCLDCCESV